MSQKVSVFLKIGVFFGQKSAKRGYLFRPGDIDGLPLIHESGGAGSNLPCSLRRSSHCHIRLI